jgi:hypothetical protein
VSRSFLSISTFFNSIPSISSRVSRGELPKHAGIDFVKWAPVRSKALMQVFADFLVACKRGENGGCFIYAIDMGSSMLILAPVLSAVLWTRAFQARAPLHSARSAWSR